jgi:hypothetical protein
LIVREFKGRVAGREIDRLWLASYAVKDGDPNYNAELTIHPDVERFAPGDYIEALVDWVVLPPKAEDYYGPNEDFRAQLAGKERSWKLVPQAAAEGSGLLEYDSTDAKVGIVLEQGGGLANLAVRGFSEPKAGAWFERVDGKLVPLGERFPEEAEPQWVWEAKNGAWDCYLSVRSPGQLKGVVSRVFVCQ